MGTQHAQRVVVKRNICTEDNTQRVGTSNQWPVQNMHISSLINGIECMCMSQCLCVCTISNRLVYCMPHHTCITIWYVQVYCVLECVRICHYDDVQVHVCNNASVCTSVSQHECMHVHALCVNCKEITA